MDKDDGNPVWEDEESDSEAEHLMAQNDTANGERVLRASGKELQIVEEAQRSRITVCEWFLIQVLLIFEINIL